jgi:phosphate-selective porin
LKDAYIAYKLNDLTTLTMGQTKIPFGHQVVESSSVREMPERSMMSGIFFPGERDRGAVLNGTFKGYNWYFGSFNGAGANANDSNRQTDVVGRLTTSLGDLELGASGYLGNGYNVGKNAGRKNRYGGDLRYYLHGVTLKAEYIWAENTELAQVRSFDKIINGGYAQLAYNVLPNVTLVGNYERMSQDVTSIIDYGLRESYNVGLIKWMDDKTRIKFFYQFNKEEINTVRNNSYIVEMISTF